MKYGKEEREQHEEGDHGSFAAKLEDDIFYREVKQLLPSNVIFNISQFEQKLFDLMVEDEMSSAEAGEVLGLPARKVARAWNKLRAKIRARTKSVTKDTVLENTFPKRKRRVRAKRSKAKKKPQPPPTPQKDHGIEERTQP